MLLLINGGSRSPNLPSWVPDWSDEQPFEFNPEVFSGLFFASGKLCNADARFSDRGKRLHVYGRKFSSVERRPSHVSRTDVPDAVLYFTNVLDMLHSWEQEARSLRKCSSSEMPIRSPGDDFLVEFMTAILRFKPSREDLLAFEALLQILDLEE